MSIGDLFLNGMKTAKQQTCNQLANVMFETMRILAFYVTHLYTCTTIEIEIYHNKI